MATERSRVEVPVPGRCLETTPDDLPDDWIAFSERDDAVWRICRTCWQWTPVGTGQRAVDLRASFAVLRSTSVDTGWAVARTSGGGQLVRLDDKGTDWATHPLERAEGRVIRRRTGELVWFLALQFGIMYVALYPVSWAPRPNLVAWLGAFLVALTIDRIRLSVGFQFGKGIGGAWRAMRDAVLVPMVGACGNEITVGVRTGGREPVTLCDAEAEEAILDILRRVNRFGFDWHRDLTKARALVRAAGGSRGYLASLVADGERAIRKLSRTEKLAVELSIHQVSRERRFGTMLRFVGGTLSPPVSGGVIYPQPIGMEEGYQSPASIQDRRAGSSAAGIDKTNARDNA